MKLDDRIILQTDILTCFDIERAGQFMGQKGFFSRAQCNFVDLGLCGYGTLKNVFDDSDPFQSKQGDFYPYFLPESCLKPKEKKYRPYTLAEFEDKFHIGLPIRFREKDNIGNERLLILNGYKHEQYNNGQTVTYIYIGAGGYTLQELFEEYEWQSHYTEDFEPFGVEK